MYNIRITIAIIVPDYHYRIVKLRFVKQHSAIIVIVIVITVIADL